MKIFSTSQIAEIDKSTIEKEPISAIDLMERASMVFVDWLLMEVNYQGSVIVFCGPGNNGGDGLVIARKLAYVGNCFQVKVVILDLGNGLSESAAVNLERLSKQEKVEIVFVRNESDLPEISPDMLIVDALFGSGLNRPLDGFPAAIIHHLNQSGATIISVDIPSGLMGEDNSRNRENAIVRADKTLTFQFPKLSFLFSENECFVGDWVVKNIDLHPEAIQQTNTPYHLLEKGDVVQLIKKRSRFSHKGTYGHALLISGTWGRMGAAVLASRACLRSGVGLLTTHLPHNGYQIIQSSVPEAMTSIDESDLMFTGITDLSPYSAIGIGPAIGQKVNTQRGFRKLIDEVNVPLVIDADALNILGLNPDWLADLPAGTILTPHPKEFERIVGCAANSFERLQKARELAIKYELNIVLKGAFSQIINTTGEVWFNSTGNPGMATGGSGDVLTGVILGLLAQHYSPEEASKIGVFIHGLAGDLAEATKGQISLIASDIVDNLHGAFQFLEE